MPSRRRPTPPRSTDPQARLEEALIRAQEHQDRNPTYYGGRPLQHVHDAMRLRQDGLHRRMSTVVFRTIHGEVACTCGLIVRDGTDLAAVPGHRDLVTGLPLGVTRRPLQVWYGCRMPGFVCALCGSTQAFDTDREADAAAHAHFCGLMPPTLEPKDDGNAERRGRVSRR
jgi:hypothetical protein